MPAYQVGHRLPTGARGQQDPFARARRDCSQDLRGTIHDMVRTLQIPYDDSVLLETSLPQADFEREAKLLLAAKLFDMGRLSSGKAAELCGMGRVEFLVSLKRVGVSMSNLRPEDVADEVAFADRA